MEKENVIHEICAVACEALDALKNGQPISTEVGRDTVMKLQTRFDLALEELGPSWWLNFAEME